MNASEIRQKFLEYQTSRGHQVIAPARLVLENDPTTLFTGSGMQPLLPYLLGEPHPAGQRLADSQPCLRLQDIEDVGDPRHTTVFEMLGNWSFGDYFKEDAITFAYKFLVEVLKIDPKNLYVTVFEGDKEAGLERDDEAAARRYWARVDRLGTRRAKIRRQSSNFIRYFYFGGVFMFGSTV